MADHQLTQKNCQKMSCVCTVYTNIMHSCKHLQHQIFKVTSRTLILIMSSGAPTSALFSHPSRFFAKFRIACVSWPTTAVVTHSSTCNNTHTVLKCQTSPKVLLQKTWKKVTTANQILTETPVKAEQLGNVNNGPSWLLDPSGCKAHAYFLLDNKILLASWMRVWAACKWQMLDKTLSSI